MARLTCSRYAEMPSCVSAEYAKPDHGTTIAYARDFAARVRNTTDSGGDPGQDQTCMTGRHGFRHLLVMPARPSGASVHRTKLRQHHSRWAWIQTSVAGQGLERRPRGMGAGWPSCCNRTPPRAAPQTGPFREGADDCPEHTIDGREDAPGVVSRRRYPTENLGCRSLVVLAGWKSDVPAEVIMVGRTSDLGGRCHGHATARRLQFLNGWLGAASAALCTILRPGSELSGSVWVSQGPQQRFMI